MEAIEVSVIVPALDEAENLSPLLLEIVKVFEGLPHSYEVIFVDDGSTDETPQVLKTLALEHPVLRSVAHTRTCGQSAALATGFRIARGEILISMDGDQQNDPADIPAFLEALTADIDCVGGVRTVRQDDWNRKLSSMLANRFRDWITGDQVSDAGCTFRSIRRSVLDEIPIFDGMHRFLPTLLRIQGYRVVEIPINHRPRTRGHSKYGINDRLWRGIRDCFAIRWYRARAIEADRIRHD